MVAYKNTESRIYISYKDETKFMSLLVHTNNIKIIIQNIATLINSHSLLIYHDLFQIFNLILIWKNKFYLQSKNEVDKWIISLI